MEAVAQRTGSAIPAASPAAVAYEATKACPVKAAFVASAVITVASTARAAVPIDITVTTPFLTLLALLSLSKCL
jgi:hypothetical protein